MQFYMQSSVIEKGLTMKNYRFTIIDIVVGCIATVVVAFFIIVACASTLHVNGITINEAKDAALALKPLAGTIASQIFAFGLFIASIFSATILPLRFMFVKPLDLKLELIRSGTRPKNFMSFILEY
jgi:Mn2+/Fe2+ NRAMP family transporter